MKTFFDCIPCFLNQTLATLRRITDDETMHEIVLRKVLRLISEINLSQSPPAMAQQIHRTIKQITGNGDPFAQEKKEHNRFAMSLIPEIRERYRNDPDLFVKMLRLSIAGNIIDSGIKDKITSSMVLQSIDRSMETSLEIKNVDELHNEVREAKDILYLGDNAGEIVFDRLFIEQLPHEKVTYVVRGEPIINDVTIEDAREVDMFDLVDVIDNGSDTPGTILENCSHEFQKRFASSDLVIAKGQGNYETLSDVNKRIFFLLQVKCPVIAKDIGFEVGSFVVKTNTECRKEVMEQ